jgi:RNA polymerase sigma factor (sigma-70 family)
MLMAASQLTRAIQAIRSSAQPHAGLTDGQLLETYIQGHEEAIFAALVHRHGPMVWGVCRRILWNHHDAEDAFQATFLVLVRKAATLAPREKVADWLYGVAHQTALKARAMAARRQARERQVAAMPEPSVPQQPTWDDVQFLLDQELSRLPAKYREVIVLCDLEGKTRTEAARQCALAEGTLATRLRAARSMLARRLARRGITLTGATLGTLLTQTTASVSASVPVSALKSTIKAAGFVAAGQVAPAGAISIKAAALTEGVIKTMFVSKLIKLTAVACVVAALAGGTAALTQSTQRGAQAGTGDPQQQAQAERTGQAGAEPGEEKPMARVYQIDEVTARMLRSLGNHFGVEVVGRQDGLVSGTDVYFMDSDLETAVVHAGLVKIGEKAVITVTVVKCPRNGEGSTKNGIKSLPWADARPDYTALHLDKRARPAIKGPATAAEPAWHPLMQGKHVAVHVERCLYEVKGEKRFYMAVRLSNLTKAQLGVNWQGRSPGLYVNQWGVQDVERREIVDERRAIHTPPDQDKVRADFNAGNLLSIPAGKTARVWAEFNAGSREDVDKSRGKYFIASLDGQFSTTDGKTVDVISLEWNGAIRHGVTDVVLPFPVTWKIKDQEAPRVLLPEAEALTARASIVGGAGYGPVTDPGWPNGAAVVFNRQARIAWWDGGGQWHAECRGDAATLTGVLGDFALIDAKTKRVILHDGVGRSFWLNPNHEPAKRKAARMDWRFTVWEPGKMPANADAAGLDDTRNSPPAEIHVYTGGNVKWTDVVVPKGLAIVDRRLEAHGFTAADGIVLEGKVIDLATRMPITARMRLERIEPKPKGGYRHVKVGEATGDADGRWVLKKAPAGWQRVIIEADGYVPRVAGEADLDDQPGWQSYDIGLARPGPVSGRVTDSAGKPLAGVTVEFDDVVASGIRYESPIRYSVKTGKDGRFRAEQVPMGKASVWVSKTGYVRPGPGLAIATPKNDVELKMVRSATRVEMTVDFTGKQRPKNYLVEVQPDGGLKVGSYGGSGEINARDQITFDDIPSGRYIFTGRPNPGDDDEETDPVLVEIKGGESLKVRLVAK